MELSFHYLLLANHAMVQKELLNGLSDTPLSMGQPKILDYLRDHDGSSQKEIAGGCHIEPPTLSLLLSRMEQSGLVERRMQNNNRRTLYVYLTEEGRKYQKAVEEQFQILEQTAFQGFSREEQESFQESFRRIYENLRKKESKK